MKPFFLIATLGLLLCVGCAQTGVYVTYYSDPEYATLYSLQGGRKGVCPVRLYYKVDPDDRARGSINAQGLKARWVSGAEKKYSRFTLPINGTERAVTFTRPSSAPNAEMDAAFALQKEANAVARRQAAAAEKRAEAAEDAEGRAQYWHTMQQLQLLGTQLQKNK